MKVYLHEIREDQEFALNFNEDTQWVSDVVSSLDEKMYSVTRPPGWKPRRRAIIAEFRMRKIDDLYHVEGKLDSQVNLLCSLCADGFTFPIQTEFHALFTKNKTYLAQAVDTGRGEAEVQRVFGKQGHSDSQSDGAIDYEVNIVEGNTIDLAELLHEQALLLIPMQPKPEFDAEERCRKCNLTRDELSNRRSEVAAEEERDEKTNPFSVLKDLFPKKK